MPISEVRRARLRELKRDLDAEALRLREFELRLGLLTPSVLSREIVTYLREKLQISQHQLAVDLGVHVASVLKWENGTGSPSFASTLLLIVAELLLCANTEPLNVVEYDPRKGILGRLIGSGALDRDAIIRAFDRLGEVMMTPRPPSMKGGE